MRSLLAALVLAIGFAPQIPGAAQETQTPQAPKGPRLQLTFDGDGKVSLISNGATLQEILREWTSKGGTPFVGAERLSGPAMTLQYTQEPETEVLRSLLRAASGLILAPRREGSVGASQFEAVYVVATSSAQPSTSFSSGSTFTPTYTQPTVSTTGNPSTELPPAGAGSANVGAPGTNTAGPGPQQQQQQQAAPPATSSGVRPVAISIVPVPSASSTTTAPPPATNTPPPANTPPPPPNNTGRGGGGGGGGGIR